MFKHYTVLLIGSEERRFPEKFGANEAIKELTAVEDWFGLGWFLEIRAETEREGARA